MRLRISRDSTRRGAGTLAFRRASFAIALLAVAVRLVYCGVVYPQIGAGLGWTGVDDGYDEIARNLLDGHGYVFRAGGSPTVNTPPGYAFLLAGFFAATGTRDAEGWPLWVFHSLIDGTTAFLLAFYARRLFGSSLAALLAAAGWALYPQTIVYAARPFSEIPFTLLLLLLALAVARLLRTGRATDGAAVGLLWGASVLFKEKLLLLPFVIVAILWKRQHRRGRGFVIPSLAMALTMGAVVAPWLLRQHAVTGRWVPITARSGRAVHFGLDTDFTHPHIPVVPGSRPAADTAGVAAAADTSEPDFSLGAGLGRIASSPIEFAKRVALKSVAFWYWGQSRVLRVNAAVQLPLVFLAVVGVFLWRRRVDLTVPLLFIGYFVAIHAVTTVRMRYSLPIMPFVILLAAAAVVRLVRRPAAAALAGALALLAAAWPAHAAEPPDSLVARIALRIHASALRARVEELTGERPVTIAGVADTIENRYSFSEECRRAEEFVAERFEEAGFDVAFESYFGYTLEAIARGRGFIAAAGTGGNVLFTEDGADWILRSPSPRRNLHALLARGDTLWAGGDLGSIFRTVDAGVHWTGAYAGSIDAILGLAAGGGDTLWAVGENGAVRRSTDGGLQWSAVPFPDSRRLTAIARGPDGRFFISAFGAFYEGGAAGAGWRLVGLGVSARLNDVSFAADGTGWLAGDDGLLFRGRDGGDRWDPVDAGTDASLEAVSFRDGDRGLVAGWDGTLRATSDGGETWAAVTAGTRVILRTVSDGTPAIAGGVTALLVSRGGPFEPASSVEGAWRNVVGSLAGRDRGAACLLTAHLDNWYPGDPFGRVYGADDNASGVAVLLEAAPALAGTEFARDIRLIAFTGEEQGKIGSFAYAARAAARGDSIAGVFNLDMVGADGDGIPAMDLHAGADPRSRALAEIFTDKAALVAPGLVPAVETARSTDASDHASFWTHGYPAVLVIEDYIGTPGDPQDPGDFNSRLHTLDDRAETLDAAYHEAIARASVAALAALAGPVAGSPPPSALLAASPPVPNPGRTFRIPFVLASPAALTFAVYDLQGRRIHDESWQTRGAGAQSLSWAAVDGRGRAVPSGVYFYRIGADAEEATGRMVVTR